MDKKPRGYWNAETMAPILAWKKANDKGWPEVAAHFGENQKAITQAYYKLKALGQIRKNGTPRKKATAGKLPAKRVPTAKVETFEFEPIQRRNEGQKKIAIVLVNYEVNEIFRGQQW